MRSLLHYRRVRPQGEQEPGFTLIELLVAVAIIAVLSAIALPAFYQWSQSAKYKGAALGIASDLRLGRQSAVTLNREARLEFDVDGKRYRVTRGNLPSGSTAWSVVKPWEEIDAEVGWGTGVLCNGTADINIVFRPNGSSDGGRICLKDASGTDRYQVVVSTISGRVKVE